MPVELVAVCVKQEPFFRVPEIRIHTGYSPSPREVDDALQEYARVLTAETLPDIERRLTELCKSNEKQKRVITDLANAILPLETELRRLRVKLQAARSDIYNLKQENLSLTNRADKLASIVTTRTNDHAYAISALRRQIFKLKGKKMRKDIRWNLSLSREVADKLDAREQDSDLAAYIRRAIKDAIVDDGDNEKTRVYLDLSKAECKKIREVTGVII